MARHTLMKVFIDSSVLLSAACSKTGASAAIVGYCKKKYIEGCVSSYVLEEIQRNAIKKLNETEKIRLHRLLIAARLKLVSDPSEAFLQKARLLVPQKDAPVLAAAVSSLCTYLITLDVKHFKAQTVANSNLPLKIVTPREMLSIIQKT